MNTDRLYELLPSIHRVRDAEQGEPLRALLQVISQQVDIVEQDIAKLYENWFIETCEDWLVPYIGDLIGYQPVAEAGPPSTDSEGRRLNKVLIPRREIANTLRYRRRKGSKALLESLANDIADWPSRAVEFYALLSTTQHLNHRRLKRGRSVDLREGCALQRLGTPFDRLAHGVDVRRIDSSLTQGLYNPAAVGLFIWRLRAYSVTHTQACCIESIAPNCFTFSALGNDTALYNRHDASVSRFPHPGPLPEGEGGARCSLRDFRGNRHDASVSRFPHPVPLPEGDDLNVPHPISRRSFDKDKAHYYGEDKSFAIWAPGWPGKNSPQPIPSELIDSADLTDWRYKPLKNKLAVDPQLGRIVFPSKQLPKKVWVSYRYGFSADIGGGEYVRSLAQPENSVLIQVCGQDQFQKALEPWQIGHGTQPVSAVIEIMDSGVYVLPIHLELDARHDLQIRAANEKRPIIRLLDWQTDQPDSLSITGGPGSHLVLDGLLVSGRGVLVEGDICGLTLRHTTLVPGWSLECDCEPARPAEPSLYLNNSQACIVIQHSILGSILVSHDEVSKDPISIKIEDSVLDATDWTCEGPECEAISAPGSGFAHAVLCIQRSTVLGCVTVHAIQLAADSIFMGNVCVARRQIGCMRFCYVPPNSRTPRRFKCQPDGATLNLTGDAKIREQLRVRPQFNSTRYGMPAYCQLSQNCAVEIMRGAEDESEMGVFHDLYQPQSLANLKTRLRQFTPAGVDAGVVLAS